MAGRDSNYEKSGPSAHDAKRRSKFIGNGSWDNKFENHEIREIDER